MPGHHESVADGGERASLAAVRDDTVVLAQQGAGPSVRIGGLGATPKDLLPTTGNYPLETVRYRSDPDGSLSTLWEAYGRVRPTGRSRRTVSFPRACRTSACSGAPNGVPEQAGSSVPGCFGGYRVRVRWSVRSRVKRAGSGRSPPSASSALP